MLYKEFFSALVMTAIIICFAVPMTQLSGESQIVPLLLLICMGLFNLGQYFLSWLRYAAKMDVRMSLRGYPLWRVIVLLAMTVLYLALLQFLGFYPDSLIYFILATLVAQPMPLTAKLVAKRVAACFVCIAFLYCLFTVLLSVQIPKGIFGI